MDTDNQKDIPSGPVMEIKLSRGKVALVDAEDYGHLSQRKWYWNGHYAVRNSDYVKGMGRTPHRKTVYMHCVILGVPPDKKGDHIDGNTLDNRRKNLRLATAAQNAYNHGLLRNNKSGYAGVSKEHPGDKWRARIIHKKQEYYLGAFDTPEEASAVYEKKAKELFGEFKRA